MSHTINYPLLNSISSELPFQQYFIFRSHTLLVIFLLATHVYVLSPSDSEFPEETGTFAYLHSVISYTVFSIQSSQGWLGYQLLRSTYQCEYDTLISAAHDMAIPSLPSPGPLPALQSCSVTPWRQCQMGVQPPMICMTVQPVTQPPNFPIHFPSHCQSPLGMSAGRAPGWGPTFLDAVVTTWPPAGELESLQHLLPLDQKRPIPCLASSCDLSSKVVPDNSGLETILRRLLAQVPSSITGRAWLASYSSMPRLEQSIEIRARVEGHGRAGKMAWQESGLGRLFLTSY